MAKGQWTWGRHDRLGKWDYERGGQLQAQKLGVGCTGLVGGLNQHGKNQQAQPPPPIRAPLSSLWLTLLLLVGRGMLFRKMCTASSATTGNAPLCCPKPCSSTTQRSVPVSLPGHTPAPRIRFLYAQWPEKRTLYDFVFDKEENKFQDWMDTISEFKISPEAQYHEVWLGSPGTDFVFGKSEIAVGQDGTRRTTGSLVDSGRRLGNPLTSVGEDCRACVAK